MWIDQLAKFYTSHVYSYNPVLLKAIGIPVLYSSLLKMEAFTRIWKRGNFSLRSQNIKGRRCTRFSLFTECWKIQVNALPNVTNLEVKLRLLLKYPRNLPNVAFNPIFLYSLLRVDIKGRLYFTSEIIVRLLYITK